MGPFSYIPFMECNHAILCMCNSICGHIDLNENRIEFENGIGYIEKDWGCSFPKSYVWCQGNHFMHSNASFMLSIAEIPFKILNFKGFLCILIIDKKNTDLQLIIMRESFEMKYLIKIYIFVCKENPIL